MQSLEAVIVHYSSSFFYFFHMKVSGLKDTGLGKAYSTFFFKQAWKGNITIIRNYIFFLLLDFFKGRRRKTAQCSQTSFHGKSFCFLLWLIAHIGQTLCWSYISLFCLKCWKLGMQQLCWILANYLWIAELDLKKC